MEMDRYERSLNAPQNYGKEIALRTLECNQLQRRNRRSIDLRRSGLKLELNSENNWFIVPGQNYKDEIEIDKFDIEPNMLNLNFWEGVNTTDLRAIALAIGPYLHSISFTSCANLTDSMLECFCSQLFSLQKITLSSCLNIGDATCQTLSKFCGGTMTHLDLSFCNRLTNKSLAWLAGRSRFSFGKCSNLEFLDISYISNIDDKGLRVLSRGCQKLLYLKLISCTGISIEGVHHLMNECSRLTTLNISKCNISRKKFYGLLEKLLHIRKSSYFFGYIPMDQAHDPRIIALRRQTEDRSARIIQNLLINAKLRNEAKLEMNMLRLNDAALSIQLNYQRYCRRKFHWELENVRQKNQSATILQKHVRGKMTRNKIQDIIEKIPKIVIIQTIFRDTLVRMYDNTIKPAIKEFRLEKCIYKKINATVLIQAYYRRYVTRLQIVKAKMEDFIKSSNTIKIQSLVRKHLAKLRLNELKLEDVHFQQVEFKGATKIQEYFRYFRSRKKAKDLLSYLRALKNRMIKSTILIQSIVRGWNGRNCVKRIVESRKMAATCIQRIFRGKRIISWKYVKMNKACIHILHRQQREIETSASSVLHRIKNFDDEDNEEIMDIENNQISSVDNKNSQNNLELCGSLHHYERSMIGLKCNIYWPLNQKYFPGIITKFNPRKEKWLVMYDDEDHEWINLRRERQRVILFADGSWKSLDMYEPQIIRDSREAKKRMQKTDIQRLEKKKIALSWVSLGWDKRRNRFIFYNPLLEKTMSSTINNDFDDWEIVEEDTLQDDTLQDSVPSFWFYRKRDKSLKISWNEKDPRLEHLEETKEIISLKEKLLIDLRYTSYIAHGILEKHLGKTSIIAAETNCMNQKIKLSIPEREELSSKMKQIATLLNQAYTIWNISTTAEFPEKEELTYFKSLQIEIAYVLNM